MNPNYTFAKLKQYMNRFFLLSMCASLFVQVAFAQELTKEEKNQVLEQLKEYKKHPESFKHMIDKYKESISAATEELSKAKKDIDDLSASSGTLQAKVTEVEKKLDECQNKPVPKCPECPAPGSVPDGVVYKVQIGLFRKFDISKYFAQPKYIAVEPDEDKNRYVISYFADKEEAEHLVADLHKMGVHDAFVGKYENGERIYERRYKTKGKGNEEKTK